LNNFQIYENLQREKNFSIGGSALENSEKNFFFIFLYGGGIKNSRKKKFQFFLANLKAVKEELENSKFYFF
jgi:hypothetical protein